MRALLAVMAALMAFAASAAAPEPPLRVGSKRFTESYILGEIVAQAVRRDGGAATHSPGLGNTAILVQALTQGAIDVYPEYTGTISREILGTEENLPLDAIDGR